MVVTSADADEAGAGGRHGSIPGVRERVSVQQENPAGDSSRLGGREGGYEASELAENLGGNHQGVGGRVKSPQGIDTPGVEELPRGDETSGVTPRETECQGRMDRGRGGMEPPQPLDKPRCAETAAETRR